MLSAYQSPAPRIRSAWGLRLLEVVSKIQSRVSLPEWARRCLGETFGGQALSTHAPQRVALRAFSFDCKSVLLLTSSRVHPPACDFAFNMSEEENENTVLGKRSRSGQENPKAGDMELSQEPAREDDEDDDDDVGPMPMPAEASSNGAVKKKRKGS